MSDAIKISQRPFGIAPDGSAAVLFRLQNDDLAVEVLSYGAHLVSLRVPDRDGQVADVVLGFADLASYQADTSYIGATAGRYANRIAGGRFVLDDAEVYLSVNNGLNSLHGGADGFSMRNWSARVLQHGVEFALTSPDGDQGFPGEVKAIARYRLDGASVVLEYEATTSKPTVVNLTNHAYFNLAGEGSATILDHLLHLESDAFTPIDVNSIPLGEVRPVDGTPLDFREPHTVEERIHMPEEQLNNAGGYDHNFVLRGEPGKLRPAAVLSHPGTGRRLEVQTTEPGIQFYSGNFLKGEQPGKSGKPYGWRSGLCLETQHYPDSPNQPAFPSATLRPDEVYRSETVWTFSADA